MNIRFHPLVALLALLPAVLSANEKSADRTRNCGCACCRGKEVCCCHTEMAAADQSATHPLRGVIVDLMPGRSALLVKHEEVPGVMRAMTMMFKVESAVLAKVKRGDALQARMSKRDDGWWLTEVEVVPPAK